MSIQQLNDVYLKAGLKDKDGDLGTSGFLLSSTGTQTDWLDPNEVSVGSSENVEILVKNISSADGGVSLSKGDPVYIYGSVGASPRLYVDLADADSTATNNNGDGKMPCAGLLAQDLAPNGEGVAIVVGKLRNLITSPIDGVTPTENDTLYVKSGGGLTLTKPTGATNLIQNVGQVGRVDTAADGNIVVSAILRSNDVPNLPTGRIWVGDGNTTTSGVVYLDETNNRLGLNTITPGYLLDVQQSGTQGYIRAWDGSNEFFKLQEDGEFKIGDIDFSSEGSYLELSNSDQFKFFTLGSQQFLVENGGAELEGRLLVKDQGTTTVHINPAGSSFLNGGNVGIGTTSPGAKLDVEGGATGSAQGDSTTAAIFRAGRQNLYFQNQRTAAGSNWNNNTFKILAKIDTTSHQSIDFVNDASFNEHIDIYTGNQSFNTRFTANGNVGIGITSPTSKLHVAQDKNNTFSTAIAWTASANDALNITNTNSTDTSNYASLYMRADGSSGSFSSRIVTRNTTAGTGELHFQLRDSAHTANTETKLMIDSGGNVGIGITNPSHTLEVKGSVQIKNNTSGYLYFHNTNNFIYGDEYNSLRAYAGNNFRIVTNSSERIRVDSSGNVGIGTTSPEAILHINGTNDTTYWGPLIKSTSANPARLTFTNTEGSGFIDQNDNALRFYHNSAYRMYINSSGNVGIGTTSPETKLDVIGGSDYQTINIGESKTDNETKRSGITFTHYDTDQPEVTLINSYIDSNTSYVSIGGSSATQVATENVRFFTATNTTSIAGTERMRINNVGNVGIGTNSPDSKLQISGSGTQRLRVTSTDGANADLSCDGVSSMTLGSPNGIPIRFVTSNQERARITSTGEVGIGKTNPFYNLDVDGDIRATLKLLVGTYGAYLTSYYSYVTTNSEFRVGYGGGSYAVCRASAFTVSSDYRLKENIEPLKQSIDRLKQLKVYRFNWKDKLDEDKVDGFIAHEVSDVIPEAVVGEKDEINQDGEPEHQGIDQAKIVPLLTAALQEAITKIEQLETRIQTLENN